MLDECVHPAEGRLERREPIGGLFRDIEENLYTIHDSLLLRWKVSSGQVADPLRGIGFTYIDFDSNCSQRFQIPSTFVF